MAAADLRAALGPHRWRALALAHQQLGPFMLGVRRDPQGYRVGSRRFPSYTAACLYLDQLWADS